MPNESDTDDMRSAISIVMLYHLESLPSLAIDCRFRCGFFPSSSLIASRALSTFIAIPTVRKVDLGII
jgi:hypothetical protein